MTTPNGPAPPTEREMLHTIFARYHSHLNPGQLDFTDPQTRAQLALDLGWLIGLASRALPTEPYET